MCWVPPCQTFLRSPLGYRQKMNRQAFTGDGLSIEKDICNTHSLMLLMMEVSESVSSIVRELT